ncbi:unnamed protein product, partial [Nesidiocoris tenuis]
MPPVGYVLRYRHRLQIEQFLYRQIGDCQLRWYGTDLYWQQCTRWVPGHPSK